MASLMEWRRELHKKEDQLKALEQKLVKWKKELEQKEQQGTAKLRYATVEETLVTNIKTKHYWNA